MAAVELAPEVLDDLDCIIEHFERFQDAHAAERVDEIMRAIDVLVHSPLIGRPADGDRRELVIGKKPRGFIALYHYVDVVDTVFVLAIRSQREAGYLRGEA